MDQNWVSAAIMFTDIVGYTILMGTNEKQALVILKESREIHDSSISKHKGIKIKEMGDGVLAQFHSCHDAVSCGMEIQARAKRLSCHIRIGIHTGVVNVEGHDVFGDTVNIASRLQSIADPGGIYVSEEVNKSLENDDTSQIQTRLIGDVQLKNVLNPVSTYAIAEDGLPEVAAGKIRELTGSDKVKSLAVLPFMDIRGSNDQLYFIDGIQEALIGELSQIKGLRVISRTSVMAYRNSVKSAQEISSELGVDALVEASILHAGDKIHFQGQFIKTFPEEKHLWSGTYIRDIRDIFSLITNLVKDISSDISASLNEGKAENETYQVDPKAYESYLKGIFHWEKLSPNDLERSLKYFQQSIQFDPKFAAAYSAIAGVWVGKIVMGLIPAKQGANNIKTYLQKAQSLNSNLADSFYWKAVFDVWTDWNWEEGKKSFEKTLQLNPNHALARAYYSHLLLITGDIDQSLGQIESALDLDPFNSLIKAIYGMVLSYTRNYEKAVEVLSSINEDQSAHPVALSTLRSVYHNQGKFDLAYEIFKQSYLEKGDLESVKTLENGFNRGGYSVALEMTAELMISRSSEAYITPWQIATLFVRSGNFSKSIEFLDQAYQMRDPNMIYIGIDPIFDHLRESGEFLELIKKLNLSNIQKATKPSII